MAAIKKYSSLGLCLFIFFVMLFINFKITNFNFGDDAIFLDKFINEFNGNYYNYVVHRYNSWSSRILIEFILVFMTRHTFMWQILNSIAMTIVCIVPAFYLPQKNKLNSLLIGFCFFMLIPAQFFYETGWVATTTNYLWVMSAALIAFLPISNYLHRKKVNPIMYVISLMALLYAANQEQMIVLLFLFLIVILGYFFINKQKITMLIPYFLICIYRLIFILTCPGNQVRNDAEIIHWLPDFANYSFLQKLSLGYSSTLKRIFFEYSPIVFMLLLLIAVIGIISTSTITKKIGGLLPLISYVLTTRFNGIIDQTYDLASGKIYVSLIILLSFIAIIYMFGLFSLAKSKNEFGIMLLLVIGGIGARMIMGFSPTIWASGNRTYLFTYSLFLVLAVYLGTRIDFKGLKLPFILTYIVYIAILFYIVWVTVVAIYVPIFI